MKNITDVSLRAAEVKRSENETQRRASSFPSEHRLKQQQLQFGVAGRMTRKLLELGNASKKILIFNKGIRRSSYEKRCGQLWRVCVTWCPDVDATQTHFQVCQSGNYWWKMKRKPNRRGCIIKGGTHTHTQDAELKLLHNAVTWQQVASLSRSPVTPTFKLIPRRLEVTEPLDDFALLHLKTLNFLFRVT